jgi:hypothetical protein
MRERKQLRDLAKVMTARRMQERAARFGLSDAVAEEARREAAVSEATSSVDLALGQWSTHLTLGLLDHEHVRRLAALSIAQEEALASRRDQLAEAAAQREAARQAHARSNARLSQASILARRIERRTRRKQEEKTLGAQEAWLAAGTP